MASSSCSRRPGKEVEETRNLLEELPRDVAMTILQKVGAIDILENVQKVCMSWRNFCKDPALWRSIDMKKPGDLFHIPYSLEKMAEHAIDRSCGQLVDINIEYFGSDNLLQYITDRTSELRRLRMVMCWDISDEGISEAAKRLPLLEELHIYFGNITKEGLENVGRSCPLLKSLTFNQQGHKGPHIESDEEDPDEKALAIAQTMPQLRHLSLFGNTMTNNGLQAILDSCPHLESLDLRQCFYINLSGPLGRQCNALKELRRPHDSTDDYEFDATVQEGCGGYDSVDEDYPSGFSDIDLVTDDDDYYAFSGASDYSDYDEYLF